MAAQVLSFFQRSPRQAPAQTDWSQQELAEFYRVEGALIRAGIRVGTDRGLSDENEPWFVFYRSDDGEVVIHFARIDGEYLIAGPAYEEIARGFDFTALVRNLVARHPLIRRSESGGNLSIHPAALLVAVVGTAFFKTGEARAAETGATTGHASHSRPALLSSSSNTGLTNGATVAGAAAPAQDSIQLPANQAVLILAAAMFASDYGVDTTSLDPTARAAISAAAAALDFGPAPTASAFGSEDGALKISTTHVAAVDNTPVQTVSSVLSLVAILATMPHATEAPAPTQGLLSVATEFSRHSQPLSLPPASAEAANWALDVRLSANLSGLPSVEAVQLIRGLAGEAGAQKISVVEVNKLPDVLADLIAKSDHYSVTPPLTPSPSLETSPIPKDPAPATPTENVETPTPSHPDPTPTPVEPHTYASPDIVKQFIDYFIAHTGSVEVMVKGAEIVMFDARVLHDVGLIVHLDSMTFDFIDGSSISLVGDHSSFLVGGILV